MRGCDKRIFSWRRIHCKSSIWAIKRNCCDIVELQNTTERKELVFNNKKIKSGVIPSSIWIKVFINNTRKELDKFLKKNSLYPIIFFYLFLPPHNFNHLWLWERRRKSRFLYTSEDFLLLQRNWKKSLSIYWRRVKRFCSACTFKLKYIMWNNNIKIKEYKYIYMFAIYNFIK